MKLIKVDPINSAKFANLKFVAAVLIVVQHVFNTMHPDNHDVFRMFMMRGLTGVAVPIFFFSSGYFISTHFSENGWWWRAIKKRTSSLMIPYFVWNIICCMVLPSSCSNRIIDSLGLTYHVPAYNVTWFLRTLFLFVLIAPVIKFFVSGRGMSILFLFGSFCLHVITQFFPIGAYDINEFFFSFKGLFYFSLGTYMMSHNFDLNFMRLWETIMCGSFAILILLASTVWGWVDPSWSVLSYPLLMCVAWYIIPSTPWPKVLIDKGFALYLLHPIFIFCLRKVSFHNNLIAAIVNSIPGCFFLVVILTLFCLITASLISRFLPAIAKPLFGGRC